MLAHCPKGASQLLVPVEGVRARSAGGATPLPEGFRREPLGLVARRLRASGEPLGAAEIAERAGLSRVTARRYLEHLVATGAAELELRYGSGRPEHRYRWGAH